MKIGPHFYGFYATDNYNVIVMDYIDGYTLDDIFEMNDKKRETENIPTNSILTDMKFELIDKIVKLIYTNFEPTEDIRYPPLADFHNGNFIYRPSDGKLFAIDL